MNIESTNSKIEQTIETSSLEADISSNILEPDAPIEADISNNILGHNYNKLKPTDPDYFKYSPHPIGFNSIEEQIYVYTNL